jgi:hypothetical protein
MREAIDYARELTKAAWIVWSGNLFGVAEYSVSGVMAMNAPIVTHVVVP